ncbi:MAG: HEAT repeat domain-containing protein [Polyangiaceae bacterium]
MAILDPDGRKLAAEALGRTGHFAAIEPLSCLLNNPDPNVRVAAIEAIGCVGSTQVEQVEPLLVAALEREDVLERLAALEAINELRIVLPWSKLEPAVPVEVLERAALTAAARSGAPEAGAPLVHALIDCSSLAEVWPVLVLSDFVSSSLEALESARTHLARVPADVRAFLYQLAEAEEFELRCAALQVVGAIGDEDASRRLLDVAEREEASGVADHLLGALANLSPQVIEERLFAGSISQRTLLLRTLSRYPNLLRQSLVMDAAAVALSSDDERLTQVALEVLEVTSDERCLRLLVGKMGALPPLLRRTSVVVLQEMALRHVELSRAIASQQKRDGGDALAAAVLIGALAAGGYGTSEGDCDFLTRCLTHDSAFVRCAAIDALADIGDAGSADALAFSLADEELEVRLAAVRALGCLRDERGAASVVERLIELSRRTDDRELLVAAVKALGDAADPRALSVLRPIAKSGEPAASVAAVEAIGQIQDPRRIDALIDGLAHSDVEVVKATMGVLAGETDVRVDAHLGACLDHESWEVRRLAADLLGRRGGDVAEGLLRAKRSAEREPLVNDAIERALGHWEGTGATRRSSPAPSSQGSWRPR